MLEIDSTGLVIIGFDWKMRCVFTKLVWGCCWSCDGETSFSCSVDSIKFGVKKCTALFDWYIIFPKHFTLGTTLPKFCLVQMKFQELGSVHACLDFLWFCKRVEMRLLDFPSVLNWTHQRVLGTLNCSFWWRLRNNNFLASKAHSYDDNFRVAEAYFPQGSNLAKLFLHCTSLTSRTSLFSSTCIWLAQITNWERISGTNCWQPWMCSSIFTAGIGMI